MNQYFIEIKTDKSLGESAFVEGFLAAWLNHKDSKLRPEYFALGEPIKRSFKDEGLDKAVRLWLDEKMPLTLRRGSAPKFTVDISWRVNKGRDTRPFPWGCSVWLAFDAGDDRAGDLFQFLIEWFDPAFGMLTTWDDLRAKHWVSYQTNLGTTEKFIGLDIGETLPGLYWQTFFGESVLAKLATKEIDQMNAYRLEPLKDGLLLRLYKASKDIGTDHGKQTEQAALLKIGAKAFFQRSE